jgi:dTMP kinase
MPVRTVASKHRIIAFEGVDGVGKTTLARTLTQRLQRRTDSSRVIQYSFPGKEPRTLGEWVYRVHHGRRGLDEGFKRQFSPAALQLLHVAAHIDAIDNRIAPGLEERGSRVILDRFWWSTYAYSRLEMSRLEAESIVAFERNRWSSLPRQVVVYLTRKATLKPDELSRATQSRLNRYYEEVIALDSRCGTTVLRIDNDGPIESTWHRLREILAA